MKVSAAYARMIRVANVIAKVCRYKSDDPKPKTITIEEVTPIIRKYCGRDRTTIRGYINDLRAENLLVCVGASCYIDIERLKELGNETGIEIDFEKE